MQLGESSVQKEREKVRGDVSTTRHDFMRPSFLLCEHSLFVRPWPRRKDAPRITPHSALIFHISERVGVGLDRR